MQASAHKKQRVILLGCSGSIGSTALQGLEMARDQFEVVAISVHKNTKRLVEVAKSWNVTNICITSYNYNPHDLIEISDYTRLYTGEDGLLKMIQDTEADVVLNGISGSAGLIPTFIAIENHKNVALANKESIVMSGKLLMKKAKENNCTLLFVDSEHYALQQLVQAHELDQVERLILTASGGPFRNHSLDEMSHITPEMATNHPTWKMGPKISVDSATLANKGLEVIEASYLFNFPPSHIDVIIHHQSIIHSMVLLKSGAIYSQMSPPDMTLPILDSLSNGHIKVENIVRPLDFSHLTLTFQQYDKTRFPMLHYAYTCAHQQGSYPIAYNRANEDAVNLFIDNKIDFLSISKIVDEVLQKDHSFTPTSLDEIIQIDALIHRRVVETSKRYILE